MENKKKCLVYMGFNNPLTYKRGVENVILFQSQSLEDNIDKYYIFFGERDEEFLWENMKCISIKHNMFRFLKLNRKIKELSKKRKVFIHSHNYLMSFFLMRKTNIFTVHDGLYYLSEQVGHRLKNIFKLVEKKVYRKSEFVHFISKFTKKNSLYKGNNFQIIYNTASLEKININKIKEEIWGADKIKIFTVRSIEERAGIELLLELASRNQGYEIKIAGKGPLLEKYKKEVKNRNLCNIELLGYLKDEDIRKYYMNCDIVTVLAKYGEGFGLPIIEGYLHNKPVFGSNICAIPEIIINKDFLVENNVVDIEEKINIYLLKAEKYDFKEYYNKKFSYKKITNEYKELYRSHIK